MRRFDYILFDLDGTLTDPGEGITNSVACALEKFGIDVPDRRALYKFIGPPLAGSFAEHYGFTSETAALAVEYYREYYRDRGIYENLLYPGVPALLGRLRAAGARLLLATSKPEVFARQILKHFELADFFGFAAGSLLDGTRVRKGEVISYAFASLGVTDTSRAVMIGDREHDIIGAKETGLTSVGVLWGYGDRAELDSAGADFIAADVAELESILLN